MESQEVTSQETPGLLSDDEVKTEADKAPEVTKSKPGPKPKAKAEASVKAETKVYAKTNVKNGGKRYAQGEEITDPAVAKHLLEHGLAERR